MKKKKKYVFIRERCHSCDGKKKAMDSCGGDRSAMYDCHWGNCGENHKLELCTTCKGKGYTKAKAELYDN